MRSGFFYLLLAILLFSACEDDNGGQVVDNFDREAMLTHWADNFIIPGYTSLAEATTNLKTAAQAYTENPSFQAFGELGMAWETAYLLWQQNGWYEIGKAEELLLTNQLNIYPVDEMGIENNIASGNYNLALPSNIDKQGFPAIGYMLAGMGEDYAATEAIFTDPTTGQAYRDYLNALTTRIDDLVQTVLKDWVTDGYRETFINNSGGSGTASVDRLVNDYIFYYEKHLRAGKVGIPAGVFSGNALPGAVEHVYFPTANKTHLLSGLNAMQFFFQGKGTIEGPSLAAYLDELGAEKNGTSLSQTINDQFDVAREAIDALADDFAMQIATDNIAMLTAYDELQRNVVNLKTDMLQVLNISVDYVDADGD